MTERVESLEKTMEQHASLPSRVDALESRADAFERQFLQFREEVRSEFSATRSELRSEMVEMRNQLRGEMTEMRNQLRGEMTEMRDQLQGEMAEMRGQLRGEMAVMRGQLSGEIQELRQGQEVLATRSEMRMLHEDLVERIKWLGEGRLADPAPPSPAGRQGTTRKRKRPRR